MNTNRLTKLGLLGQDVIDEYSQEEKQKSDEISRSKAYQALVDYRTQDDDDFIPVYHSDTGTWYNMEVDASRANAVLMTDDGDAWSSTIDDADPEAMKQWAMDNGDWEVHNLSLVRLK